MKFFQRSSFLIIALALIGGSFYAGTYVGSQSTSAAIDQATTLSNKTNGQPSTTDFTAFWTAWNVINQKYVITHNSSSTTDQDKVYGAIKGMVASLGDPYTTFFTPSEDKVFQSEISGNFEGVGMEVGLSNGLLTVSSALKGTPAQKAGLLPGDKILKIDATDATTLSADQAVTLIRGAKGTTVSFTILRTAGTTSTSSILVVPPTAQPVASSTTISTSTGSAMFVVKVTRDTINIPTISTETKPGGIFVIHLYTFTADSPNLFRDALRTYVTSGNTKLILDLRGNPGGYLDAAVDIASWFLPAGDVVVREDYGKGKPEDVSVSKGYNIFSPNMKMAILIDGGSASASEILSGALSEHGKAKLVGTRSFGKGSVQELVNITPDTALKVTIARWLTPNGKSISEGGLTPDVTVPYAQADAAAGKDPQMEAAISLLNK